VGAGPRRAPRRAAAARGLTAPAPISRRRAIDAARGHRARYTRGVGDDPKPGDEGVPPTLKDPPGTIQLRRGPHVEDAAPTLAPVMPTVTGEPVVTSAPPALPPARYELGAEIARGGMGRVVEATDTTLDRVVALKEALSLDGEALRRFARETKITARLEHPSIVPVHDAGVGPNGAPYYVMRKIGGRPLEKLVATAAGLSERLALIPHLVAAAQAIAHAHERGIVHRDIKPSNILVGDLGETIVIDWGLAKVIGETDDPVAAASVMPRDSLQTRAGIVYGTPGFMAPEQLRGNPVDPKFDVYALGATLYHLLSRKPPHHAKTADEMMRAAVTAPPTPIGELVKGVPPELSAIVDKALAHDPAARYASARSFAEDLARFISGQLVAAHHYTPRERLARFVHKHRVPVAVAALAMLVLVTGAIVAVRRIVDERDRADAAAQLAVAEKRTAEERAAQLTLSQAWMIAESSPTLAIAMVKPLATTALWREVIPVAAAARAAGVAWSLPASRETTSLAMSGDGTRVLSAGRDGVVRLHETRTTRTLVDPGRVPGLTVGPPVAARFADDERKVVLWQGSSLTIYDLVTSDRRELHVPTAIESLDVVGITAYWADVAGNVWQLDLAGSYPLQLPLDERVSLLAASPDGRWLALAGDRHLWLHDRTTPSAPPLEVTTGSTQALDWATDGSHLAVLVDDSALDIAMRPVPLIVQRLHVGRRDHVVYSANRVYTVGPTGVALVSRDGSRVRRPLTGALALHEARQDTIVAATEKGLAIMSDLGDHFFGVPTGRVEHAQASPRSPFVVAAIEDRLLVWNLDDVQPRELARQVASAHFAGKGHVIVTSIDGPDQRIELATGTAETLEQSTALTKVAYSAAGDAAVIVDVAHQARLLVPGKPAVELGDYTDFVGFASPHQILLGAEHGGLQLHDTTTGRRELLVERASRMLGIAWSRTTPAHVAAVFADQTLWRKNLATGAEQTQRLPQLPNSSLHVLADGTVLFAVEGEVRAWGPEGALTTHVELPHRIQDLGAAGPEHVVAFAVTGAAYLLDARRPGVAGDIGERFEPEGGDRRVSMAADTGLVGEAREGRIELVDPLVKNRRWTLASTPGVTYSHPQLSTDGRWVLARTPGRLLVWQLARPASAEDTAAWLEAMTNAVADDGAKSFGWN